VEITAGAVVLIGIAVIVGAAIQSSIGFGMNLVTVPVLALVLPAALPATVVLLGIPISVAMLRHEHRAIDRPGLTWILVGRVPGTIAGTIVVATVSAASLKGVIGVSVLAAVIASAAAPPITVSRVTQFAGGLISGTTGTAAGIGGPPLALLYQHHPGPTMRATLAASFFVGTILSVAALAVAGQVSIADSVLAAGLVPLVIGGSSLGRRAHRMLDRDWLRPAVLGFATVAAVVVIVDALR
jgi:uncharacterized protein